MSRGQTLKTLLTERLTAAAEEIFARVEQTIAELEEENRRKQRILDQVLNPCVRLSRAEVQNHPVPAAATGPKQEETRVKQEETWVKLEETRIKQEEAWVKKEEEQRRIKQEEEQLPVSAPETSSIGTQTEPSLLQQKQSEPTNETQRRKASKKPQNHSGTETGQSSDTDEVSGAERDHCQVRTKRKRPKQSPRKQPPGTSSTAREDVPRVKKKSFKCLVCSKSFAKNRELIIHNRVHTGEKPYNCSVCHKSFSQKGSLQKHEKNSHRDESDGKAEEHQCSVCKKIFASKNYVKFHISTVHLGSKPFSCSICGLAFSMKCTLKSHMGIHTEDHRCTICDKTLASERRLLEHGKVHTGERAFSCSVCDKTFKQSSHLKRHKLKTHREERDEEDLKKHQCDVCKKRFWNVQVLELHSRVHTGDKPFSCSECNRQFSNKSNLRVHLRTHTGERPYSCSQCDRTFVQTQELKAHMRTHTGEKPYSCSVCDKAFMRKQHLKAHMNIHTGMKPFCCSKCDKGFTRKRILEKHMETHAGENLTGAESVQSNSP